MAGAICCQLGKKIEKERRYTVRGEKKNRLPLCIIKDQEEKFWGSEVYASYNSGLIKIHIT